MDFFDIAVRTKSGKLEIYPNFEPKKFKDLMIRGKAFYAIWNPDTGLWSTDPYDAYELIDRELYQYRDEMRNDSECIVCPMSKYSSGSLTTFNKFVRELNDIYHPLDENVTFLSQKTKKTDYASKRLPYDISYEEAPAYDELISTLYSPEERRKLEWAIGSIFAGDGKKIQKFIVLYGDAGTGKSTFLNIVEMLFEGYCGIFNAADIASANNQFSLEAFKNNPLVAIQHDGNLSRIDDNTKLNSLIAHEEMIVNEKHKALYSARSNAFLFMGTNQPVQITDAKSGIIRRLIDVNPTGQKIPARRYQQLMKQIPFELGAIAGHCLNVYNELGRYFYDGYRPLDMMYKTDVFFNFVESYIYELKQNDPIQLKQAYDMYKQYCDESNVPYPLPRHKFREELKNYYGDFKQETILDGRRARSVYSGFLSERIRCDDRGGSDDVCSDGNMEDGTKGGAWLSLVCTKSAFDMQMSDAPAQYGDVSEKPVSAWSRVSNKLRDLDTTKLHYVRVPINHIVIDFDLKDESGQKSKQLNLEAASKWPPTYAEFSKGGSGIHLHYIYDGDPEKLSPIFDEGIEIKVFKGKSSLRRKLTFCNDIPIAHISGGLPLKGEKKMVNLDRVSSEKHLRAKIEQNLRKEVHAGTKPSVDFIFKILEDAYNSDLIYDVTDLRQKVLTFAMNSTHHADYCIGLVAKMRFKSENYGDGVSGQESDDRLVFFDIEVFPNLFLVNWKYEGADTCVRMINPEAKEIENLIHMKLVGFNCRRYDNHILYARYLGKSIEELYLLSQKIINEGSGFIGEAYNVSYTDVYDFASAANKKSLKKFEIELGIHHQELGLPWDQPVPEDKWTKVAEYCDNDVIATEAVFHHLKGDWVARQILAELSGMTVNDTTNQHSTRIILGKDKNPQHSFSYRNLGDPVSYIPSEMGHFLRERTHLDFDFLPQESNNPNLNIQKSILPYFPGYKKENGKSTYRGEEVGEGGYVYAEPGIYSNVALLDVASMHPTSMECEYLFGPYTWTFSDIKRARVCIKHRDIDGLRSVLDGKLVPFVERAMSDDGDFNLKDLSNALKTVINSVYGLTSASFEHPFHDPRNVDNIVAKRGALFMVDLKHAVQEKGFTVAHIKTDSIKIPNATPEIIQFVMDFGRRYGYEFEHEATYDRMCLVNDAVYIAKYKDGDWTATGAQFAHPYVFKTLFSKEPIEFKDLCETKSVSKGDIYIDFQEGLPSSEEHNYTFVGRVGSFVPVMSGFGGGTLYRIADGKAYAISGTKGYLWREAEELRDEMGQDGVDMSYFHALASDAIDNISRFGDFEYFVSPEFVAPYDATAGPEETPPWDLTPCKHSKYMSCTVCPKFVDDGFHYECAEGYDLTEFANAVIYETDDFSRR